jgi:hypothetical protein
MVWEDLVKTTNGLAAIGLTSFNELDREGVYEGKFDYTALKRGGFLRPPPPDIFDEVSGVTPLSLLKG